jgi:hypothetical protein
MRTLKKLHANVRKWMEGGSRRKPTRQARLGLETLEDRLVPSTLVLGTDGNLWQEAPGWQTNGRTLIDSHVRGFAQGNDGYDYVLGTDGNLWKEYPYWQLTNGRTWVDGNVRSFARGSDGYDYVLGTNGNLWRELPGWQTNGRTWVDGNVLSFARGSDGYDYVLGTNGNLWRELPGWQTNGRSWVDGNVQSFAYGGSGYVYAQGTDGNLWLEAPGWQSNGRTWVDGKVQSFALGSDGYEYVLGTDGNLWREQPFWSVFGRTWIDRNVLSFAHGNDGYDYVLRRDNNLYQELPGTAFGTQVTWLDANVRGFVEDYAAYFVTLGPRPAASTAYTPVNGTLFGPGGPSYLDVQQGAAADCWLLASLAEVATRAPWDITSMFTYVGSTVDNGSMVSVYSVRLYDSSGVAQYVTVDTELPGGGGTYDHPVGGAGAVNGSSLPVLWVALAEKAYVEANAVGLVTTQHVGQDSYSAVNFGDPVWALRATTGKPASDYNLNTSGVVNAWNAGQLVVLCTNSPASSYIVGNHCYAMVNYNSSGGLPFEVFNPWGTASNGWVNGTVNGTYGLFWANAAFIAQNFATESFGNGAAPGIGAGRHAERLQQVLDRAFSDQLRDRDVLVVAQGSAAQSLEAKPDRQEGRHAGRSQKLVDLASFADLLDPDALTPSDFARL